MKHTSNEFLKAIRILYYMLITQARKHQTIITLGELRRQQKCQHLTNLTDSENFQIQHFSCSSVSKLELKGFEMLN